MKHLSSDDGLNRHGKDHAPSKKEPIFSPRQLLDLPAALQPHPILTGKMLRRGDPCPQCGVGVLDYDGALNLGCAQCRYSLAGCFT